MTHTIAQRRLGSRNTLWVQLDKKYDPVVMIGQDLPESQYSMSAIR